MSPLLFVIVGKIAGSGSTREEISYSEKMDVNWLVIALESEGVLGSCSAQFGISKYLPLSVCFISPVNHAN